jgi:hypothetical protein
VSLTSLIRTDPEFRTLLTQAIRRPARRPGRPGLQIPARSSRCAVTGTAFDYLLRFELERRHDTSQPPGGTWVAELGALQLGRLRRKATEYLRDARVRHAQYVSQGDGLPELARAATVLAKLDLIYRAGWEDPDLLTPLDDMAAELQALLAAVPFEQFQARHTLLTNPQFGLASQAVGGADADLVIDDSLIDIKTTKAASVTLDELRQLVGYVLLWTFGDTHRSVAQGLEPAPTRLTTVGLYYARFGVLEQFRLADLLDPHGWSALIGWFQARYPHLPEPRHEEADWPEQRTRTAMEAWLEAGLRAARHGGAGPRTG